MNVKEFLKQPLDRWDYWIAKHEKELALAACIIGAVAFSLVSLYFFLIALGILP